MQIENKLWLVTRTAPKSYPNDYCDHVTTNTWIIRADTPLRAIIRASLSIKEDITNWPLVSANLESARVCTQQGHDRSCEYTSYWAEPLDLEEDLVEI